jgi:Protein of unknown function (DUF1570)/Tetratricopeptide repeat
MELAAEPAADSPELACVEAAALVRAADMAGARDRLVAALGKHPTSPILRLKLARVHLLLRDPTAARIEAERALKAKPGWPEARLVEAEARATLGDAKGAIVSLDAILAAGPRKGHVADLKLARRMLDDRGIRVTVSEAAERGLLPIDLPYALATRLKEVIELLARGPRWGRTYEKRTRHYVVRTDVGTQAANGLSMHLELARTAYAAILPPPRASGERALLVLAFGSRAGYVRNMTTLVGSGAFIRGTVGAYVPEAKCLALLVEGHVESLLPTIYHEAFHACVDARVGRLPRWLDEGLAQAFPCRLLGKRQARWRRPPGRVASLRARLTRVGMPTSADVIGLGAEAFGEARTAPDAYALAWIFADFLLERDATGDTHAVRTMLAALREGRTPDKSVTVALGAAPRTALDAAFMRHVRRILGTEKR